MDLTAASAPMLATLGVAALQAAASCWNVLRRDKFALAVSSILFVSVDCNVKVGRVAGSVDTTNQPFQVMSGVEGSLSSGYEWNVQPDLNNFVFTPRWHALSLEAKLLPVPEVGRFALRGLCGCSEGHLRPDLARVHVLLIIIIRR